VNVEVSRRATRQLAAAEAWWLRNRDKAPEAFAQEIAELEAAIADADAHPNEGIDADELIRQLREERERRYPSTR